MKWRLSILVTVQTLALVAMIGMKQYTLATGTQVELETRPIDPRSLFRGDYVRLNYVINQPSHLRRSPDEKLRKGDPVYVVLQEAAPYWEAKSVHLTWPDPAAGEIVIRGRVRHRTLGGTGLSVKYGIERYFVPEGEGRALERPKPGEKITIRVAIDRFGKAAIHSVLVNGKPRYTETLF